MTKKNGTIWKIIAIVVAVAMAVAGWVWNAAVLSSHVDTNKTVIAQIEPKVEANEDKCLILEMKLDRLDEKLSEQKERQQAMLVLQQQILDLVSE
jgi:hypothetical protein